MATWKEIQARSTEKIADRLGKLLDRLDETDALKAELAEAKAAIRSKNEGLSILHEKVAEAVSLTRAFPRRKTQRRPLSTKGFSNTTRKARYSNMRLMLSPYCIR